MNKQKLEPCPFCGKSDSVVLLNEAQRLHYVCCTGQKGGCGARTTLCEKEITAVLSWNGRTPSPENKALTVEDMVNGSRPVWVEHLDWITKANSGCGHWGIPNKASTGVLMSSRTVARYCDYGKTWLAYHRPPEKGE